MRGRVTGLGLVGMLGALLTASGCPRTSVVTFDNRTGQDLEIVCLGRYVVRHFGVDPKDVQPFPPLRRLPKGQGKVTFRYDTTRPASFTWKAWPVEQSASSGPSAEDSTPGTFGGNVLFPDDGFTLRNILYGEAEKKIVVQKDRIVPIAEAEEGLVDLYVAVAIKQFRLIQQASGQRTPDTWLRVLGLLAEAWRQQKTAQGLLPDLADGEERRYRAELVENLRLSIWMGLVQIGDQHEGGTRGCEPDFLKAARYYRMAQEIASCVRSENPNNNKMCDPYDTGPFFSSLQDKARSRFRQIFMDRLKSGKVIRHLDEDLRHFEHQFSAAKFDSGGFHYEIKVSENKTKTVRFGPILYSMEMRAEGQALGFGYLPDNPKAPPCLLLDVDLQTQMELISLWQALRILNEKGDPVVEDMLKKVQQETDHAATP